MRKSVLLVLTVFAATAHAQSRQELTDQIARLQTDLAETRRFAGSLTDRLAVLESQQEALQRWKREAETAMKQRNDLAQRVTELEKETAVLRQRHAEWEQRQAASPAAFNATPGVGAAARTTAAGAPGAGVSAAPDGVLVDDSMNYLSADSTAAKPAAKRPAVKAKPKAAPRKKAAPKKRKRRRR